MLAGYSMTLPLKTINHCLRNRYIAILYRFFSYIRWTIGQVDSYNEIR